MAFDPGIQNGTFEVTDPEGDSRPTASSNSTSTKLAAIKAESATEKPRLGIDVKHIAGEVIRAAGATANSAATAISDIAGKTAAEVASATDSGMKSLRRISFSARIKRARIAGFRDGIKQGAHLLAEKKYAFYYAYVATLCYFLRLDGNLSEDDCAWLQAELKHLRLNGGLPDNVKAKIQFIADTTDTGFEALKEYLDNVGLDDLESIREQLVVVIALDEQADTNEIEAERLFSNYCAVRAACLAAGDSSPTDAIEKSAREYGEHIDRIDQQFREKTGLQDSDVKFLVAATMLQVARVLVINHLTQIERAGQGNSKEKALKSAQERLFDKQSPARTKSRELYASKGHIITARGVPYDANCYHKTEYDKVSQGRLFKGANHRFATLGHDPLLGLIFGTSNIMTNTITVVRNMGIGEMNMRVPATFHVLYDAEGKNPRIGSQVSTIKMLSSAGNRVTSNEADAAALALIKHLIHIGTDLYIPCGIQIPFANLVLDKAHAEKLTGYVSTGDLLKVGVQAGMTVLINWLIASLHGCTFIFKDDNSDYAVEMHQVRTKKILLMSDTIATSSSVVQATITKNPKCLDLGGAAVLAYRLFTDGKFIAQLKGEYLNSKLNKIYDERAKGLL